MVYSERTLLISGSNKGLEGVINFLKVCGCGSVTVISSGSEARRLVSRDDYGLILINTPLLDESGYHLALKLSESTCAGIILICKADAADEMSSRTMDYGVCIVPRPLSKPVFSQAVRTGMAFNRRLLAVHQENNRLRAKLEEMRVVSRAKFLLITHQQMTEEDAHRHIEKNAMDTRRTRKEVSLEIIGAYEK